ncbi:MAG: hypothetical protein PHW73_14665 [Atribacterota bacterium]|jgi:hypothetical protein|nr:hypothetical protein [Atribacterota bacterium]
MSEPIEKINQQKILTLKGEIEMAERDLTFYSSKVLGVQARLDALNVALEVETEGMTKDQKEDLI